MTRLEELRAEYERLQARLDEEWAKSIATSWEEYVAAIKPIYAELHPISRELHMTETDYKLEDFCRGSDGQIIGDLIPVAEFWRCCEYHGFIDSDGVGFYATETQESNIPAIPSEIADNEGFRSDFPFVMWYNK